MDFSGALDLNTVGAKPNEAMIRLLVCRNCKTIDEMPDYDNTEDPDHERDVILHLTMDKHQRPDPHIGVLMKFPLKYWVVPKVQEEIIKQIHGGAAGLDAFQKNFYATRMTFAEDAMTCFSDHLRPKGQCPDYRSDKKMLKPETSAERKEAGLEKIENTGGPKVYLCDFCPVKSYNMEKFNTEKGLYK